MSGTANWFSRDLYPQDSIVVQDLKESFRSRFVFKSIDAAIIAHLKPKQSALKTLMTILDPRTSNYERVAALVSLSDVILPGMSLRISRSLSRSSHLPFLGSTIELINYGSGSSVFLLGEGGKKVLKMYRRSLGRNIDDLLYIAKEFKTKYEMISSWYAGPYSFIIPTTFLVLHGPALDAPAAAAIQPYIHGEKIDLFNDLTDEALVSLLQQDEYLKKQFIFFAQKTLEVYEQYGLCHDFMGRENMKLVRTESRSQLVIIDYGIINLRAMKENSPERFSRFYTYLDRLRLVLNSIGEGGRRIPGIQLADVFELPIHEGE
jgi:hypothetical protein